MFFFSFQDGFKRIVEYTADDHNGFNAVVHREPFHDVKVVKKVYDEPNHLVKVPVVPSPVKYYHEPHAQPKYYAPAPVQKVYSPIVKTFTAPQPTPQYYAPPEHPKYFKPAVKTFVKPAYPVEPIKYVQPAPHYNYNHY